MMYEPTEEDVIPGFECEILEGFGWNKYTTPPKEDVFGWGKIMHYTRFEKGLIRTYSPTKENIEYKYDL